MSGTTFTIAATAGAVASLIVALALPFVLLLKTARFSVLQERYFRSRPGWIAAGCVLAMVTYAVIGIVVAAAATVYPFLWATLAIIVSAFVTTAIYLALYVRTARKILRQSRS
jgi:uncharacterized protein (DUF983 family)